jgi:hypothetical protein
MTLYISSLPELSEKIAAQSLIYSRNEDEIRYTQPKTIVPWDVAVFTKTPTSPFGWVAGVVNE